MGIGHALRGILGSPVLRIRLTDGGLMDTSPANMSLDMEMFNRHSEITRTVEAIPGAYALPLNRIHPILSRSFNRTYPACTPTSTRAQSHVHERKPADASLTQAIRTHAWR